MSYEIDYLPVATATGANVDSQANFQGSSYQLQGFQNGIAEPYEINKILRQCSMIGNAIATIISQTLSTNVLDDGNSTALISNLENTLNQVVKTITNAAMSGGTINGTTIGASVPAGGTFTSIEVTSPVALPLAFNKSYMAWNQGQDGNGMTTFINASGTGLGGFQFNVTSGSGATSATAGTTVSSIDGYGNLTCKTIYLSNPTTAAASALPATPTGYLEISIAGTVRKLPYY